MICHGKTNPNLTPFKYAYDQQDHACQNAHYKSEQLCQGILSLCLTKHECSYMSQCMRFPTMWYVRPAKPQISLRICAV